MVYQLDDELWFPDPHLGDDNGMVAVGGDLSTNRLLLAYSNGFFPWFAYHQCETPIWYCPLQRFVIFPQEIHVSHSMKQLIAKNTYSLTVNKDFEGVIQECATVQNRDKDRGAWLSPAMVEAYTELHRRGYAASIEVWEDQQPSANAVAAYRLVGGLYGVNIGHAFFGESMFSLVPNASKLALIFLARLLHSINGRIIDCQFETPHLRSMGGRYISYEEYMKLITH